MRRIGAWVGTLIIAGLLTAGTVAPTSAATGTLSGGYSIYFP